MRIAFSCPPVPGHLLPMTALARKVRQHGHDVFFLGLLDAAPAVQAAGLDFVPFCEEAYPSGEMARRLHTLSKLSGVEALQYTMQMFADACKAALDDGPRAIRASKADALVLDATQRGLNLAALSLGIPFIHISNALHFDFSGETPLCLYDWPHAHTPEARARNQQGNTGFAKMMEPMMEVQRSFAARSGLNVALENPGDGMSTLAHITQTPREFDFPEMPQPPHFHYAGPFHDSTARPAVSFPWDRLTGEPLIYASMGTLQNGSEGIFRMIAEAAQAQGRQLVVSIGRNLEPAAIGPVAESTIVVQQAPQLELLKRAALCITHAGLNTALESLSEGVPMVAIPVTNDQPGVGARIAYTQTGTVVPLKELSVDRLRSAIDQVSNEPHYRENAASLQRAIHSSNGLEKAAAIIDRTLAHA